MNLQSSFFFEGNTLTNLSRLHEKIKGKKISSNTCYPMIMNFVFQFRIKELGPKHTDLQFS